MDDASTVGFTPIRVRGRKARRPEETPSKRRNGQLHPALTPRRKKQKTKTQSTGQLSRLESLPPELIEQIFLECLEFNLPRASPQLAVSLSRERLFRALILYALWTDPEPSDHKSATAGAVRKTFRPLSYTPISIQDRYTLQSAIFACRWCTYQRVKVYLRDMVELNLTQWLYGHGRHVKKLDMDESEVDTIAKWTEQHVFRWCPFLEDGRVRAVECSINPSHFKSLMGILPWIWRGSMGDAYIPTIRFHPVRVVSFPDKLVNGTPWSDKKIAFFQLLRGWLDPVHPQEDATDRLPTQEPYSLDKLQSGIHTAIIEQNPIALRSLLELDETNWASSSGEWEGYTPPHDSYRISSEHFMTAVRSSEDPKIFRMLIRCSAESLPSDDPEVTAWAMRLDSRGEPFGKWLLNLMASPTHSDGRKMFELGKPATQPYRDAFGSYDNVFGAHPMSWLEEILEPIGATIRNEERTWTLEG